MQIIEFAGLPGAGKSFISNQLYLAAQNECPSCRLHFPQKTMDRKYLLARVVSKGLLIGRFLIAHPRLALIALKITDSNAPKLVINWWLYAASVWTGRSHEHILFDQGVVQLIWSSHYRGASINDQRLSVYLSLLYKLCGVRRITVVNVCTPIAQHHRQLTERVGMSPLEQATQAQLVALANSSEVAYTVFQKWADTQDDVNISRINLTNSANDSVKIEALIATLLKPLRYK